KTENYYNSFFNSFFKSERSEEDQKIDIEYIHNYFLGEDLKKLGQLQGYLNEHDQKKIVNLLEMQKELKIYCSLKDKLLHYSRELDTPISVLIQEAREHGEHV